MKACFGKYSSSTNKSEMLLLVGGQEGLFDNRSFQEKGNACTP